LLETAKAADNPEGAPVGDIATGNRVDILQGRVGRVTNSQHKFFFDIHKSDIIVQVNFNLL
jgi:hypothetical protein